MDRAFSPYNSLQIHVRGSDASHDLYDLTVAHLAEINYFFGAGIAKTALLGWCHVFPALVAWLGNGELNFLHNN